MKLNIHIHEDLEKLAEIFGGDIYLDHPTRILYATDASAYREVPIAVARPKDKEDIRELVEFAKKHNTSLIPRGAGTSLAGQVVGAGIVVDVSKYMNRILEVNPDEKWVRVEPGVVLDELNLELKQFGLFFSPETSTSNRCMIGGMVGNNSCGSHSLVYGSTRDHLISVKTILSDSSEAEFGPVSKEDFYKKCELSTLEGRIYQNIEAVLSNAENQKEIRDQFPDPNIRRRNTGYAIDLLLESEPFSETGPSFNFSKLLAGSEGTLTFFTECKLSLDPLPPPVKGLVCGHFVSLGEALEANLIALKHCPVAVELMDRTVIELSKQNITQSKNRFFIDGNPEAILIIEFAENNKEAILQKGEQMIAELKENNFGYHFPVLFGNDIPKVWQIRKAGLGLLSNMPGDAKPVAVIEDTAVLPKDLPAYIKEIKELLNKHNLLCAFNAHIGTGELHIRPVLDLKKEKDVALFQVIAEETAKLVKKYKGSLSGEHGDGRLRGQFIPFMIGDKNLDLLWQIKVCWDPENIFNQAKIFHTPIMNTSLRYEVENPTSEYETVFDFSDDLGFLRSLEKCNGSGDCRKSELFAGTMCPSYQATRDENATTRARANLLREMMYRSEDENPFANHDLYDILELCISCKGCKSECPSNVDMAKIKAEFLQQYYQVHHIPYRVKAIAHLDKLNKLGSGFPVFSNFILSNGFTSGIMKKFLGIAPERSFPKLSKQPLKIWFQKNFANTLNENRKKKVYFFADEFSAYNDTKIAIKAIKFLQRLGYHVEIPDHESSGRAFISKGLLHKAKVLAEKNVALLKDVISGEHPLVGIEPSAILTFRDEYPDLLRGDQKKEAIELGKNVLLIEEFICHEFELGNISSKLFIDKVATIKVHGHCQQKALSSVKPTIEMLSIPENYSAEEIPSGCCGMAGSFGYEKEHYEISNKIGELVLFPEVKNSEPEVIIAANGTSCRCQIKDGTNREAFHPVEILFDALIK